MPNPGAPSGVGYSLISANSINATVAKSSSAFLWGLEFFTPGSTIGYLKLYDKSITPAVATDIPIRRFMLPGISGGTGLIKVFSQGLYFLNGLSFCITGAIGDTDNTSVAANGFIVNLDFG